MNRQKIAEQWAQPDCENGGGADAVKFGWPRG